MENTGSGIKFINDKAAFILLVIHSLLLLGFGVWGYFDTDPIDPRSLLLVVFGTVILISIPLMKNKDRWATGLVPVILFFLVLALARYMVEGIIVNDVMAIVRHLILLLLTMLMLVRFFPVSWLEKLQRIFFKKTGEKAEESSEAEEL